MIPPPLGIYLDNFSTTRPAPEVIDAMLPFLRESYGNANSDTRYGRHARKAVQQARDSLASLIGADAGRDRIVLLGSATEANNLALLGATRAGTSRSSIVVSPIEHVSVQSVCQTLRFRGQRVREVAVDGQGRIDLEDLERAVDEDTLVVSVMLANNEVGVVVPIAEVARIVKAAGALLHVDASQAVGRHVVSVKELKPDLMTFSSHKMHGPKGVGALFIRRGSVRLEPLYYGGGQEKGLRPGTSNVPAIVGFGKAAELAEASLPDDIEHTRRLRDRLEESILKAFPDATIHAREAERLSFGCSVAIPGVPASALSRVVSDVSFSWRSACSTESDAPSHVLSAMNIPEGEMVATIRLAVSRYTTEAEMEYASRRLIEGARTIRGSAFSS